MFDFIVKIRYWKMSSRDGTDSSYLSVDAASSSEEKEPSPSGFWGRFWALVLGLLTVSIGPSHSKTFSTEVGVTNLVQLDDGSTALLNTDSEISYEVTETRRHVELIKGEALFTVAHGASMPFDVVAGGITTRAVGTEFDVHVDEHRKVDLMVTEGKVRFGNSADFIAGQALDLPAAYLIEAGHIATTQEDGHVSVRALRNNDVRKKLGWTRGVLEFNGEKLPDVVREMNRYNHTRLEIGDPSIEKRQMGGIFPPTDLETFLATLRFVLRVDAVESGKTAAGYPILQLCGPHPPVGSACLKKDEK